MLIENVILGARSNVTDQHGFPLKFLLIIVTKNGNLAKFYPTPHRRGSREKCWPVYCKTRAEGASS